MDNQVPPPSQPTPATPLSRPATTGDTVTVACKLPHGLILRVFEWEEFDEPLRDGGTKRGRRSFPVGEPFTIRGTWVASAGQAYMPNNSAVAELLPGGYALTPGVPRDLWEKWLEQNQHSPLVKNKVVFAHATHTTATQMAQEHRAVVSGMEPLDRNKPAERMPGGVDRRLRIGVFEQDAGTAPR